MLAPLATFAEACMRPLAGAIHRYVLPAIAITCGLAIAPVFAGDAPADGIGLAYDPVIGSRWTIQSNEREDKVVAGKTSTTGHTRKEELTIVEKTAAGFRVDFVLRTSGATGSQTASAVQEALFGALRDVVIHAQLENSGKPLRIDNLEEVRTAFKKGFDQMVEVIKDTQVKEKIREMLESYLSTVAQTPEVAAETFLDNLSLLAVAQDTGLKVGEERRSAKETSSPFGGDPMKVVTILRLADADPAGDRLTYAQTYVFDPAEMKDVTLAMVKKMGLTEGNSGAELEKFMKQLSLSMDDHTEFKVEKGMTRTVTEDSNYTLSARGLTLTKHDRTVVEVAPMQ